MGISFSFLIHIICIYTYLCLFIYMDLCIRYLHHFIIYSHTYTYIYIYKHMNIEHTCYARIYVYMHIGVVCYLYPPTLAASRRASILFLETFILEILPAGGTARRSICDGAYSPPSLRFQWCLSGSGCALPTLFERFRWFPLPLSDSCILPPPTPS